MPERALGSNDAEQRANWKKKQEEGKRETGTEKVCKRQQTHRHSICKDMDKGDSRRNKKGKADGNKDEGQESAERRKDKAIATRSPISFIPFDTVDVSGTTVIGMVGKDIKRTILMKTCVQERKTQDLAS